MTRSVTLGRSMVPPSPIPVPSPLSSLCASVMGLMERVIRFAEVPLKPPRAFQSNSEEPSLLGFSSARRCILRMHRRLRSLTSSSVSVVAVDSNNAHCKGCEKTSQTWLHQSNMSIGRGLGSWCIRSPPPTSGHNI